MPEEGPKSGGIWAALTRGLGRRAEVLPPEPEGAPEPRVPEAPPYLIQGVLFLDENDRIRSANAAASTLLGRSTEELVGCDVGEIILGADTLDHHRPQQRRAASGEPLGSVWELEILRPDDEVVPVEVSTGELVQDDKTWRVLVLNDLGDRTRRVTRLLAANERLSQSRDEAIDQSKAKTITLARLAEVLRTPLSAIIGYGELLIEEAAETGLDDAVADVSRILESSDHLLAILKNVLDLAEIEAGRMAVTPGEVEPADAARTAIAAVQSLAKAHGNRINFMMLAETGSAWADPERVAQILRNLCDNACRYTTNGSVTVRVAREMRADEERIAIHVQDTGDGLTPEQLTEVFVEYGRRGGSRNATGAGISLVVSAALAELMGGSLTAVSTPGNGSIFTLSLPMLTNETKILPPMLSETGLPIQRRVNQLAVRVVVDNDELRKKVLSSLERGGWPTESVRHAESSVEDLVDDRSLIIADRVPGVDLLEALRGDGGPMIPVLQLLSPDVPDAVKQQLDALATGICVIEAGSERAAFDEVLHGAVTRSIMIASMSRRFGR